jgi:hypothetical protein
MAVRTRADYLQARALEQAQEEQLHQALREAFRTKRLLIRTDGLHLSRPDSPVYVAWDQLAPLMVLMLSAMTVMLFLGIAIGLGAMTAAILAFIFGMRPWVSYRIQGRVEDEGLRSVAAWKILWKYGGIALVRTDPLGVVPCIAPKGDWRAFMRRLESDLNPPDYSGVEPEVPEL